MNNFTFLSHNVVAMTIKAKNVAIHLGFVIPIDFILNSSMNLDTSLGRPEKFSNLESKLDATFYADL